MTARIRKIITALFVILLVQAAAVQASDEVVWQDWTDDLFTRAQSENRFVILDLEAVWCHWCHVMEKETYGDPEVQRLLKAKYIAVRVDQDANPDLASRYGDWGWPATIIFAPDGSEVAKLRGYKPARGMAALLQAFIDDPSPGPSVLELAKFEPSATSFLTKDQRKELLSTYDAVWDEQFAGWGTVQKFIHTESLDYAITSARNGDRAAGTRARRTLDAALNLIDPVWGGVYQYSDQRNWLSPHFEKIMWYQTQYLRQYSLAHTIWARRGYLDASRSIYAYLTTFLRSDDGVFFTSQDADLDEATDGHAFYELNDEARRKLGVPRIDTNIYARENGWAISGLVSFYNATADPVVLADAETAARWIMQNRSIGDGGYSHGANDRGGPYLSDTLAMGQALLDLYAATGEREWLEAANRAGEFIALNFKHEDAGFVASVAPAAEVGVFAEPVRQIEENMQLARFTNQLHRYTGNETHRSSALQTMRYLTSEQITTMRRFLVGVVLADEEIAGEPIHITIVGNKDDPAAIALHEAARRYPALYKRVDWWDRREGPMLNTDIEYPELERAAAFACGNRICSLPVFEPAGVEEAVERMSRLETRTTRR
jgi:uncharacterized protein YyaL (SSP411 family)